MLVRSLTACLVAGLASVPALAGPISPLSKAEIPAADTLIIPVHGCHREAEPDTFGWHVHRVNPRTGNPCQRTQIAPRGGYVPPVPPRYYPPPPRRPVCFQECNYIGPIRQCRTVCR
jgi:hypothetical protein